MKAILVQPPFVQLNTPYPAVHYLESFLISRGVEAAAFDHSLELYLEIFSSRGLPAIFDAAEACLASGFAPAGLAPSGAPGGAKLDARARTELSRYLSYRNHYIAWIDSLAAFLAGRDPGLAHRLGSAAELPRGARASAFLEECGGLAGPDQAQTLAARILDDLGDLVAFAFDPDFGTVKYAERLAASRADFSAVRRALDASPLLGTFYTPLLDRFWSGPGAGADLVLIAIPFPGCLAGALSCARSARRHLGPAARIVFGGGYVSTELRNLRDPGIFDFCDQLAFDAGYGALASILDDMGAPRAAAPGTPLHLVMSRPLPGAQPAPFAISPSIPAYAAIEREAVRTIFPDYRGVDFSRYLRVADSSNPMHRLWSDTPWLKYHLARGCYWRKCSFCDTELEYVADFSPALIAPLAEAASAAAARTGLHGIHFVDEAMPMASLLAFASANRKRTREGERPFHFWGNMRFDASWTPDRCAFLAASGLVAVSGGIEIATERGLKMTDKGFDLPSLVRTLVSLKRAGILVHAYLIYGFPGQSPAEIEDSAEFCRQLFVSGLVDSAFWHRFVLTRHSRMYAEWKAGERPDLVPIDSPRDFADNDLSFEGESAYDRFDAPLAAALSRWMSGADLGKRMSKRVDPDLAENLIARAEADLARLPLPKAGRAHWIAGTPRLLPGGKGIEWACRGELERLESGPGLPPEALRRIHAAILDLAAHPEGLPLADLADLPHSADLAGLSGLVIV